jgi:hypothetical protein
VREPESCDDRRHREGIEGSGTRRAITAGHCGESDRAGASRHETAGDRDERSGAEEGQGSPLGRRVQHGHGLRLGQRVRAEALRRGADGGRWMRDVVASAGHVLLSRRHVHDEAEDAAGDERYV